MKKGYGLKGEEAVMPERVMWYAHIRKVLEKRKVSIGKSRYAQSDWGRSEAAETEMALYYLDKLEGKR